MNKLLLTISFCFFSLVAEAVTPTPTFTPTPTPTAILLGKVPHTTDISTNTGWFLSGGQLKIPTATPTATATPTPTATPAQIGHTVTAYAAGTIYSLTGTDALVHFGTTDPTVVLDQAGTYLIFGRAYVVYNGATFAANQTATLHLRRTNNTPADVANATTSATLRILTGVTDTVGVMPLPPVVYTTTNTNDSVSVFGALTATPAAGSVDVKEASVVALKIL